MTVDKEVFTNRWHVTVDKEVVTSRWHVTVDKEVVTSVGRTSPRAPVSLE